MHSTHTLPQAEAQLCRQGCKSQLHAYKLTHSCLVVLTRSPTIHPKPTGNSSCCTAACHNVQLPRNASNDRTHTWSRCRKTLLCMLQSQRPMSSSEGQAAPAGPVQEPSDRWLGAKGPGHIHVAVQYLLRGNGDISSSWEVDTSKAIPSKLPMFIYRCADTTLCVWPGASPLH